jgi:hypothetical protein
VVTQSAESPQAALRPRFPALDPEPPPRRPWRIAALALIVALALAGGVSYAAFSPSGQHKHPAASAAISRASDFDGIVLAETNNNFLSLTDLRTGKEELLKGLGVFGENPAPVVSADHNFLIDPDTGKVISLSSELHPAVVPNHLSFYPGTTASYPWSDHDSYIVESTNPNNAIGLSANLDATVQSVQTGNSIDLGAADNPVGDPQQAGAFFAVPAPGNLPAPGLNAPAPDSQLVLADTGAATQVLATSGTLTDILGFTPGTAVTLVPLVNRQGTMVAVQVAAANQTSSPAGIVVLSRSGTVLGAEPIEGGGSAAVSWSGDGSMLAFVSAAKSGLELVQWKIAAKAITRTPFPKRYLVGECFWSPDNSAVLCRPFPGQPTVSWVVVASGRAHVLAEQGLVLAWLSGRLGR